MTVPEPQIFSDVACTVCGCVCDDLRVIVAENRISHVEGACKLAEPWFAAISAEPIRLPATIDGRAATLTEAVNRAAEILDDSRAPLIWGLSRSSTAGQRAAVLLGERIGANVDTTASVGHGASIVAIQEVGASTCSLGEVRNRADLVIFWGANPVESHPRHFERYSVDAIGEFIPRGRADRTVIVVDDKPTATSALADSFVQVPRDRDFEVIWALRQLIRGMELPESFNIGVPHEQLRQLAKQMTSCRYGTIFYGRGLAQHALGHKNIEALLRLVAELNDHTRFTARGLHVPGNAAGADSVLSWMTGFPFAVNFSRGYPRYNPGEYSANELLERGEVDACLLVGSESVADLSPRARQRLQQLPTIALDYSHATMTLEATVQITTAIYGVHVPGTAYRMDEVPIPLRPFLESDFPTDERVLEDILKRLP